MLGMTVDGMRVWDIRRAIQIVRQECPQLKELRLRARSGAEEIVLLASLYEPPVETVIAPMINGGVDQQSSILNLTRSMPAEMLPVLRRSWPVAKLNRNTAAATTSSPINMPTRISSRENPPWSARWLVRGGRWEAIRRTP